MEIYLDNSATTRICPEACEKMTYIINNVYGNPSSLHSKGLEAEHEIKYARKIIADMLSVDHQEIFFTSGGTEANNLAVFGSARARKKLGNRIVTTAVEHSSVYESCKELEKEGFEVIYLEPDESGRITQQQIDDAVNDKTVLVSVMAVNNETGVLFPVECISRIIRRKKAPALFHCDAVQAFGKILVKPNKLGADLLTVSSHKIHGPKGSGALFIKKGTHIKPIIYGGEQEKKIRPGTEALPLICGFGAAAECVVDIPKRLSEIQKLRDYAVSRLLSIDSVVLNSPDDALPYIINISACGVRSETMLHFLESRGIYISSGSACAKGKKSHVLTAMGLPQNRTDSALRISFSKYSTMEEIDLFAEALAEGLNTLVRSGR